MHSSRQGSGRIVQLKSLEALSGELELPCLSLLCLQSWVPLLQSASRWGSKGQMLRESFRMSLRAVSALPTDIQSIY